MSQNHEVDVSSKQLREVVRYLRSGKAISANAALQVQTEAILAMAIESDEAVTLTLTFKRR